MNVTTWAAERTTVNPVFRGTQRRFPHKYIKNTFEAIQSTLRSLEMHSKRCIKISICSLYLFGDPRGT